MSKPSKTLNNTQETLLMPSVLAQKAYEDRVLGLFSPFKKTPFWTHLLIKLGTSLILFCEAIVGAQLRVKNELFELIDIDVRLRKTIAWLLSKGIVTSWQRTSLRADQPPLIHYTLTLAEQIVPSGREYRLMGGSGGGVGANVNEALIRAVAETFERHSLMRWDPQSLKFGNFESLKQHGAVEPSRFVSYSESQLGNLNFFRSRVDSRKTMHWVNARSLVRNDECLIPAQPIYFNFEKEFPDDPVFSDVNTSGTAAASSTKEACLKALCEAVERDGFMLFWLNKISPPQINLQSIPSLEFQRIYGLVQKYNLQFYILDTTTDMGIPSFSSVLIDEHGDHAVSVSAVAGFDYVSIFEKLILETVKFLHLPSQEPIRHSVVANFSQRRGFWKCKESIGKIHFFLNGPSIDLQIRQLPKTVDERIDYVRKKFEETGHDAYIVSVTSKEAHQFGLRVVKVVTPSLIPLFFNDIRKPLGIKRIYETPRKLGLSQGSIFEYNINMTPHPFM